MRGVGSFVAPKLFLPAAGKRCKSPLRGVDGWRSEKQICEVQQELCENVPLDFASCRISSYSTVIFSQECLNTFCVKSWKLFPYL